MHQDMHHSISLLLIHICRAHRGCAEGTLNEIGLHAGQEAFLCLLWNQDGQTQTQLAEQMGIQPPTLHKMVARLESAGMVMRRPDAEDQRVSRVYLLDKGRALHDGIQRAQAELEARTTTNLTLDERVLLRRLLLQVQTNLTEPG